MSADNGYIVSRLNTDFPNEWGIYYYSGDDDYPAHYYNRDHAIEVYSHPLAAVIRAHQINDRDYTEYGVSVNSTIWKDVDNYFSINSNWIVKHASL